MRGRQALALGRSRESPRRRTPKRACALALKRSDRPIAVPQARVERLAVLSDTHFGDDGSTLGAGEGHGAAEAEARAGNLVAALLRDGPVDELVLLGDIFELWTADFEQAALASKPFLDALERLDPALIVYVPGNHDYHLLVQHREEDERLALREGILPPWPTAVQQTFGDSYLAGLLPGPLRDRFVVTYPNYVREIGGVSFLFHHGHHLATLRGGDVFALGPRFVLEYLERLALQDLSLKALERGSHVFFEMTHNLGVSSGARERVVRFWGRLLATGHVVQGVRSFLTQAVGRVGLASNRGTPLWDVANFRHPARRYLDLMSSETGEPWHPDVLVFGHTHRQGIARVVPVPPASERLSEALQGDLVLVRDEESERGDFHLVNTGCWHQEADKRNAGHSDIVALVDGSMVRLCRLVETDLVPVDSVRVDRPSLSNRR